MHRRLSIVAIAATLALSACGGNPPAATPISRPGAGAIHAIVQTQSGASRLLSVDYAAAGLAASTDADEGSLVIVGVFRDGRVDDSLDLQTLSISVPMSELPGQTGNLDVVVDGAALNVLLEGSAESETRVVTPEAVHGSLHLRYDAPPRPGITLRGEFSLLLETQGRASLLRLDGEFEVPVLGG